MSRLDNYRAVSSKFRRAEAFGRCVNQFRSSGWRDNKGPLHVFATRSEALSMETLLCTFNANNLFVRYKFTRTFPRDMSGKSTAEDPAWGYLPVYNPGDWEIFNQKQRELADLDTGQMRTIHTDRFLSVRKVQSQLSFFL